MGLVMSSNDKKGMEYIHSPKPHCPIKPFPISVKPISIPIKMVQNHQIQQSSSCPSSFECKMIYETNVTTNKWSN